MVPIELTKNPEGTVVVARCFGDLSEDHIFDALNFAFGLGRIEPGLDRIVKFDPDTNLHELDIKAMRRIQRLVVDHEGRGKREVGFRSVLVHSSPVQLHFAKLYKAIWGELELPGVEFLIVASEREAWKVLDSMPSAFQRGAG